MTTLNNYELPLPLFKALTPNRRIPILGRISATALIDSPLRRVLQMKYFNEITDDASDNLWALLGRAIHAVVEKSGNKDTSEVKVEYLHHSGATLVTVGDYYENNILTDWKCTSVWSLMLGTKEEWINQLNVIRYIYGKKDMPVEKMQVYAILRDHMKSKIREENYPQIPFQQINIPIWDAVTVSNYISERIALHLEAEKNINNIENIPQCSEKERWARPDTFAVKKRDQKKAVRVLSSMSEARRYIDDNPKVQNLYIETRKGVDGKCAIYCNVNTFCPYFKSSAVEPE